MKNILILIFTGAFVYAQIGELKKEKIFVGPKSIAAEIAQSPEEMARGLMFRHNLDGDNGMLFVYQDESVRKFWMKNTFIPLSIGFFNKKQELIDVQEMIPVTSELQVDIPTYESLGPAMYALEMPTGWFKKNHFEKSKKIKLKYKK